MSRIRNVGGTITKTTRGDHKIYSEGNIVQNAGGTIIETGKEKGVSFGKPEKPKKIENITQLTDIYFAKKLLTPVYEDTEEIVTVLKGENEKKIRARFIKEKKIKKSDLISYTPEKVFKIAKGGENVTIKYKKKIRDDISFQKITETKIKKKIWVIAICDGLKGKLTVEINENKLTNTELVYENPVKFLIEKEEKTKIEFDLSKDKTKEPNVFAKEITLQPKTNEDVKKLIEKFNKRTDKKAFLFLKGEITETTDQVIYPNQEHEFKNKDKERLEVLGTPCYCDRDITVDEFKKIIKEMRISEKNSSTSIFTSSNCTLPDTDKTYERLTEEYNKVCKKHEINTCVRKIHFFAQTYWEADRFKTTLEYSDGEYLNPDQHDDAKSNGNTNEGDGPRYRGRGLMQLTWRSAYESYFNYVISNTPALVGNKKIDALLDRGETYEETYVYYELDPKTNKKVKKTKIYKVDSASLVASKIELAIDSAGWFWNVYKKVQYGKPKMKTLYKEILGKNLNEVADFGDKYVDIISKFVNGGGNGKANRKTYYESLRDKVFNIKDECINYDKIKK